MIPVQRIERDWLWAKVEYDGSRFLGFQTQSHGPTVQDELERAVQEVTGLKTRVIGAGRTDRGVHARGQMIAFQSGWKHDLSDLHRALNAVLAADVAIVEMGYAPEGFHPRFSPARRVYRYTLLNQAWRSPLARRLAWHVPPPLNLGRMAEASRCLVGTHDFATFGRAPEAGGRPGSSATVRTVAGAEWHEERPFLVFEIEANAFLFRMVRSIVGMLVWVGSGRMSPRAFEAMLEARDRSQVKQIAPAHGLCLVNVDYVMREGVVQ